MAAQPNPVLVAAFKALTDEHKDNLRWHMEKGTPVVCGADAELYTDGRGGG